MYMYILPLHLTMCILSKRNSSIKGGPRSNLSWNKNKGTFSLSTIHVHAGSTKASIWLLHVHVLEHYVKKTFNFNIFFFHGLLINIYCEIKIYEELTYWPYFRESCSSIYYLDTSTLHYYSNYLIRWCLLISNIFNVVLSIGPLFFYQVLNLPLSISHKYQISDKKHLNTKPILNP